MTLIKLYKCKWFKYCENNEHCGSREIQGNPKWSLVSKLNSYDHIVWMHNVWTICFIKIILKTVSDDECLREKNDDNFLNWWHFKPQWCYWKLVISVSNIALADRSFLFQHPQVVRVSASSFFTVPFLTQKFWVSFIQLPKLPKFPSISRKKSSHKKFENSPIWIFANLNFFRQNHYSRIFHWFGIEFIRKKNCMVFYSLIYVWF